MIGSDENLSPGLRQKYKFGKLELDNGISTLWASIYSKPGLRFSSDPIIGISVF
jgi:hypothetical protein